MNRNDREWVDPRYQLNTKSAGHQIAVTVLVLILTLLIIAFGFDTLVIWLASKIFEFEFKWLYVFGLMVAEIFLRGIFGRGGGGNE